MKAPYFSPLLKRRIGFVLIFTLSCISVLTTLAITLSYETKKMINFTHSTQFFTRQKAIVKSCILLIEEALSSSSLKLTDNRPFLKLEPLPSFFSQSNESFDIMIDPHTRAHIQLSDEGSRLPLHSLPLVQTNFSPFSQLQSACSRIKELNIRHLSFVDPQYTNHPWGKVTSTYGPFIIPLMSEKQISEQLQQLQLSKAHKHTLSRLFFQIRQYFQEPLGAPPPLSMTSIKKHLHSQGLSWDPKIEETFIIKSPLNINSISPEVMTILFNHLNINTEAITPLLEAREQKLLSNSIDFYKIKELSNLDKIKLHHIFSYQPSLVRADISIYEDDILYKKIFYIYKISLINNKAKRIGAGTVSK